MKVLMVSRYVQPSIQHSNANVYRQALSLKCDHGIDVEILTWPLNDQWTGPVPEWTGLAIPPLRLEAGGLVYHVINPPTEWNERPLHVNTWEDAVAFGVRVLDILRPDIVHLQHWFGLWWILDSAQRLGIPTVYSNHDWGMVCLRTILLMGNESLCDGHVAVEKCANCIWQARNIMGKANEFVADTVVGRMLIETVYRSSLKTMFERHGAVRLPVRERVNTNLDRAKRVLGKLDAMFTPSQFGRTFFQQLGVPAKRIQVKPWYHDVSEARKTVYPSQPFTITYIGRVSPEKGVHHIFDALTRVKSGEAIQLKIAGANTSTYCLKLKDKYATRVGMHKVEWLGWSEIEPLFLSTDVVVIPSTSIDNTPLSLIEALTYKVPVVASKVPTMQEFVIEGQNGYLADFMSLESLGAAFDRAIADKSRIRSGSMVFPKTATCREYTSAVKDVYLSIRKQR